MEVKQAVELRKKLETQILNLLEQYRHATGATPTHIDLHSVRCDSVESENKSVLVGVSVTVEL